MTAATVTAKAAAHRDKLLREYRKGVERLAAGGSWTEPFGRAVAGLQLSTTAVESDVIAYNKAGELSERSEFDADAATAERLKLGEQLDEIGQKMRALEERKWHVECGVRRLSVAEDTARRARDQLSRLQAAHDRLWPVCDEADERDEQPEPVTTPVADDDADPFT